MSCPHGNENWKECFYCVGDDEMEQTRQMLKAATDRLIILESIRIESEKSQVRFEELRKERDGWEEENKVLRAERDAALADATRLCEALKNYRDTFGEDQANPFLGEDGGSWFEVDACTVQELDEVAKDALAGREGDNET